MKKAQYDHNPPKLEAVGNGSHLYRWNIEEVTTEEGSIWECYEVVVWNEPTSDKLKEAVINAMWGKDLELKLLNDYNAANEGLMPVTFKQPYLDYISDRNALKTEIDDFFAA